MRAGSGATAYISESQLQEHDHLDLKAQTLIAIINRAPIRVRLIDWGMTPTPAQPGAGGNNFDSRPQPTSGQLGTAAKGDNLPPPKVIQQAPLPGTMFWAVRSYCTDSTKTIEVEFGFNASGRLIHSLAARALIQTFEDKAVSITDPTENYRNECDIMRLGKTYSLASTQTSFVATMNGVGTRTIVTKNPPPSGQSLLSGIPLSNMSGLSFISTQTPAAPTGQAHVAAPTLFMGVNSRPFMAGPSTFAISPMNFASRTSAVPTTNFVSKTSAVSTMSLAANNSLFGSSFPSAHTLSGAGDGLSEIIAAQDDDGAFESSTVERIVFPRTGIPAVPAFISILEGRDNVKDQIWLAICVIAFFKKKYAGHSSKWSIAKSNAEKFVKTTLCCIFGVNSSRSEGIFANSLDDAGVYFY